ncbi:glycosyltransferase [Fundidesulfovibrio butyratiphilus]
MNVVLYCQHVLGLGHFMRSLALAEALAPHRVALVSGGPPAPARLPQNVELVPLPPLAMDEEFSVLYAPQGDLETVKTARAARLLAVLERERPDVLLVELYPFGRRAFEFELVPALQAARSGRFGPCRTVCSLRDILVEKNNPQKYQDRVLARLDALFDGLLVHADPEICRLKETFPRADEISVPVAYTGFVTQTPSPDARTRIRSALGLGPDDRLAVASAGGGKVGGELLEACLDAFATLSGQRLTLLRIFTGPFLDDARFTRLASKARTVRGVHVERFATDFPDWLAAADLSISLAGYNTTMNVLAAATPALVRPFDQNREQALRARRLESLGALGVLEDKDLGAQALARRMLDALDPAKPGRAPRPVRLDGAETTARLLGEGWPAMGTHSRTTLRS